MLASESLRAFAAVASAPCKRGHGVRFAAEEVPFSGMIGSVFRVYLALGAVILLAVPLQLWLRRQARLAHKDDTAEQLGLTALGTVGVAITVGLTGSWLHLLGTVIMVVAVILLYRRRRTNAS